MKQTLLLFLFAFLSINSYAQLVFADEAIEKSFLAPNNYDVENKLSLHNESADDADFIWDVETVYTTEGWNFYVCDLNKCYGPGTTGVDASGTNTLSGDQEAEMRFHLQPNATDGTGQYILRLRNPSNSTEILEEVTLTFNGSLVDTKDEQIAEMNIFPNPVGDVFKLSNENGLASHIQLFDVLGRQIKSFDVSPNSEYYIGDIAEGRYFARIFDNNGRSLKVVRLIKRYNKA